jgi:hypothetical protein
MPTAPARNAPTTLTSREDSILRTVNDLHFVTARDITHLLFSKGSLTYSREMLSRLAGGKDYAPGQLLLRFPMPTPSQERVYTLGVKGRQALQKEGYYRPYKFKQLSYGHLMHALTLTRFVAAATAFCRQHPDYTLLETLLCYEIAQASNPVTVSGETSGKRSTQRVIPDACLLFAETKHGQERLHPIIVEIDRGSEDKAKWTSLLHRRITLLRSGNYRTWFGGERAVKIAYVTTGRHENYRKTRRRTMGAWTMEALQALKMEQWASVFRFASVTFSALYTASLFDAPEWYRPDSPHAVPLLESIPPKA